MMLQGMDTLISIALQHLLDLAMDKLDGIVNIERDISSIQETFRRIERIEQVAEEKQIDDDDDIQNWLCDVVDIRYEAHNVLNNIITEETSNPVNTISSHMLSFFCGSSRHIPKLPLATLNRLANDIRSVKERIDEKIESETFTKLKSVVGGGGSGSVRVDRRLEVGPFINKQGDGLFLGRENVKKKIMEKILHPSDNRVHVVVILGMGGIGKTTLAQSIYNDEGVKEVPRSWLWGGENKFSAEKVIREILNEKKNIGIRNLDIKLKQKLRGDRFLIVLDDIWDVDGSEWDLLFNPLTEVGNGGLIIITTRKRRVCTATNTQTTYDLEPLSEDDSWLIFRSRAFVDGNSGSKPYMKDIGKYIVKKLKGHPLALEVVGRSLFDKDFSTWTDFLESKFSKDDEVMSALRWSYNHLPRHLKLCFTYCALFPKDHVLDKKVLVEMWMAHDLIEKEEQERSEDVGAHYLKQLVNASLLQCVDGKYTIHDLIHDLALLVSIVKFATTDDSLPIGQMDKVRHVTMKCVDYSKIPRLCNIEKLLTLYTISSDEKYTECRGVLDDIFKQLKSIRVLVLSSEWIYEIPDCISKLKHLRYLDVSKTSVKSLPDSLCDLYHLQTLGAPLDAILPRNIVNMVKLRHLRANLSTCKGVGKLTSLQELSSIHVCVDDNIRDLGYMQSLHGKLTIKGLENVEKLEDDVDALMEKQTLMDELELKFDKQLEKSTISAQVIDALGCPSNLKCLKISGYNGDKSPSWMVDGNHKFDRLQTLELYDFPKLESLPPFREFDKLQTLQLCDFPKLESLPPLGELTFLKHLSLWNVGVKRLGKEFYGKFTDGKVFFPSLELLELYEMEEWEEWDDIIIENPNVSFFPYLTTLEIKECAKLVSVLPVVKNPIMNAANFMASLSSLKIWKCNGLKSLQLDALISLKELDISDCRSLVNIISAIRLATTIERLRISSCILLEKMYFEIFPCLVRIKYLNLHGCASLRSLCASLRSLEHLHINGCPTLELAFEDGSGSSSSSGNSVAVPLHYIYTDNTQVFRTLLHHELVSLESLNIEKLTEFENFDETEANNFCKSRSLKSLRILQCKDLKSLPSNFHNLSSLENLHINSCPLLQSLPPDFHRLSSLKDLIIINCPQFQSLLPIDYNLSSLESLHIHSCPQLQSLPADFHKLSSLKSLCIEYCPQLQSLPADGSPPFLRDLTIEGCPLLYERCKDESGLDWHKIKHIRWKRITTLTL